MKWGAIEYDEYSTVQCQVVSVSQIETMSGDPVDDELTSFSSKREDDKPVSV